MHPLPDSSRSAIKNPSAFLPLIMSLAALALVLGAIAFHGVERTSDEGAIAHLWQLLMAGQVPVIAFFAIKWLPRKPRQAWSILGLQTCAAFASMAPVYFLKL